MTDSFSSSPGGRSQRLNLAGACPTPLRDYPHVVMGHGGGGKLSQELVEHIFLPSFDNDELAQLGDAAILPDSLLAGERLVVTTDSYVVQPLFFPGGSIGELAVHGTVNDLAMKGAQPLCLTAGFILEEGFPMDQLQQIAQRMGAAAKQAGVAIVAGDTKVVERARGDGCYINTAGVGKAEAAAVDIAPQSARAGDAVLVSGTLGDHGMAVMSRREGLRFESAIVSDTAPLNGLVRELLATGATVHTLRDPTRGGLAASLTEIATAADCGIRIDETQLPVRDHVRAACEFLGLDPLLVANEGKLVCVAPAEVADQLLATMRAHALGADAAIIGSVLAEHPGIVSISTALGASRVLTMPLGEQLPRIC